jgi:hypothetical protein
MRRRRAARDIAPMIEKNMTMNTIKMKRLATPLSYPASTSRTRTKRSTRSGHGSVAGRASPEHNGGHFARAVELGRGTQPAGVRRNSSSRRCWLSCRSSSPTRYSQSAQCRGRSRISRRSCR